MSSGELAPKPWLPFPEPRQMPRPTGRPLNPGGKRPDWRTHLSRIGPQFSELQRALRDGAIQVDAPGGQSDPELIVVFVLAEPVDEFKKAAEKAGIAYLTQINIGELPEESGFTTSNGKPVKGYAHGVVTNSQTAAELIAAFNLWQKNSSVTLARGLGPLKRVFQTLHEIRRWGPVDRVRETGLLEIWRESVALAGGSFSPKLVEIELWYHGDPDRRQAIQAAAKNIIDSAGGRMLATAHFSQIRYHGLLAEISAQEVEQALVGGPEVIRILNVDDVMFAAPGIGSSSTGAGDDLADAASLSSVQPAVGLGDPRVALLDGLPSANHQALTGFVNLDDEKNLGEDYPAKSRRHGTAMASLIIHGDLDSPGPAEPIYVLPVLRAPEVDGLPETTPTDELLVDTIHKAFVRMFEDPNPTAASVRIVNLSIGCPERVFVRSMSPLARMLDWLCFTYNKLIVVSAGNHQSAQRIALENYDEGMPVQELKVNAFQSIRASSRLLGLLSPAEAVNALTVGAASIDGTTPPLSDAVVDLVPLGGPAFYSGQGYGFKRSTKPDILTDGGRVYYAKPVNGGLEFQAVRPGPSGPGHRVATPTGPSSSAYLSGTSNATALVSRSAAAILRTLESYSDPIVDPQYYPVAVRALIAHGADWDAAITPLGHVGLSERNEQGKIAGYGLVRRDALLELTQNRAVLLGAGTIAPDERQEFVFPVPPSLFGTTEFKRLKFTLAWFSDVGTTETSYVQTRLSLADPPLSWGGRTGVTDKRTLGGTLIQHTIEGGKALVGSTGESWTVAVEAKGPAGVKTTKGTESRFALVGSIEVGVTTKLDIRQEVRQALVKLGLPVAITASSAQR